VQVGSAADSGGVRNDPASPPSCATDRGISSNVIAANQCFNKLDGKWRAAPTAGAARLQLQVTIVSNNILTTGWNRKSGSPHIIINNVGNDILKRPTIIPTKSIALTPT